MPSKSVNARKRCKKGTRRSRITGKCILNNANFKKLMNYEFSPTHWDAKNKERNERLEREYLDAINEHDSVVYVDGKYNKNYNRKYRNGRRV